MTNFFLLTYINGFIFYFIHSFYFFYSRIKDVATAKKVLRGVASLPDVKNTWEFFKCLSIFEAIQGT